MEKTLASADLIESDPRDIPDSQLAARINTQNFALVERVQIAATAASQAVWLAILIGQACEIAMARHEGDFGTWLKSVVAHDPEGNPLLSESTARKYRMLYRKRDLLFPADGSAPPPRNISEAYVKIGLMPEPEASERDEKSVRPLFRVNYTLPDVPAEKWPAAEKRAFLERTQPIVDLREKLMSEVA